MTIFQIREPSSYNSARQRVPYTSAAASSAGFGTETQQVRIAATSPVFYLIFSGTDTASTAARISLHRSSPRRRGPSVRLAVRRSGNDELDSRWRGNERI
jgi:hypothetical protein